MYSSVFKYISCFLLYMFYIVQNKKNKYKRMNENNNNKMVNDGVTCFGEYF